MSWFYHIKDVFETKNSHNGFKKKQATVPNDIGATSVAALTLMSLLGHFSYNAVEGNKQLMDFVYLPV